MVLQALGTMLTVMGFNILSLLACIDKIIK